nr:hypothetical protein [Tanacetum cinerariifolium]
VLDLETTKTTQAMKIESLKRRVPKLKKKQKSRTYNLKRLYKVGLSARVESSKDKARLKSFEDEALGEEDASKQGRIADIDSAQRLKVKEQDELTDVEKAKLFMEFLEKRRKFFAAKRAKEKRNMAPTRAQQRTIITELLEESSKKVKAEITQEGKIWKFFGDWLKIDLRSLRKDMYLNEVFGSIFLVINEAINEETLHFEEEYQVKGRIIRIKSLHEVTDVKVCVNAAKLNLVLLSNLS